MTWRGALTGALLLLAFVLVGLVTTVDRRPWRQQGWGREAIERRERMEAASNAAVVVGELRAGFGRALITPERGAPELTESEWLPLAGYGDRRGAPATGVHDPLWAKAIAFSAAGRTGIVLSADLLIVPREVCELVQAAVHDATGVPGGHIYFGATHTHCGPGGWAQGPVGEIFAGPFTPGVREWLAGQMAAAATRAIEDLTPAEFVRAGFVADDLVRNRLMGDGAVVDPEFNLLLARQADGDFGVVGSFSAHPTVLSGSFMQFSAEYPGVWQREVEERTGGIAMFLGGSMGSHAPRAPERGMAGVRMMGETLAARTFDAIAGAQGWTNRIGFGVATFRFPLPELQARVTEGLRLRPWVSRRLLRTRTESWVQALRLGDAVWFSTPGDYSGELAVLLKEEARGVGWHAAVTSFNGDYTGYIVPAEYYGLKTYETRTMSFFGPEFQRYIDDHLRWLMRRLRADPGGALDPSESLTPAPQAEPGEALPW